MPVSIVFGLMAALCYGVSSFVARFSGKESGVLVTLVWGQILLFILASIVFLAMGGQVESDLRDFAILGATNLIIVLATTCLYKGLAKGRVTIVAPVMASYGGVSALLSVSTGEPFTWLSACGLLATIIGAILSAFPSKKDGGKGPTGLTLAIGAALLFGVGYWLQGKFVLPVFGPVASVWLYYLSSATLFGLAAVIFRAPVTQVRSVKDISLLVATALLGGGGFAATLLAQRDGEIAIASALSSASTAVTVLLALVFLRDKPSVKGLAGLALVLVGVILLHFASS